MKNGLEIVTDFEEAAKRKEVTNCVRRVTFVAVTFLEKQKKKEKGT